jgi:hypothetical protein
LYTSCVFDYALHFLLIFLLLIKQKKKFASLSATTKGWLATFHTTINHNRTTQHTADNQNTINGNTLNHRETIGDPYKLANHHKQYHIPQK